MTARRRWRIDPLVVDTPQALVAGTAEALAALADDGIPRLRWYRATETAVVRGRAQRHHPLPASAVPVLDRPTGGGAVLLDPHLLSCDVLVPATHPLAGGDPMATFDRVGAAWRDALAGLGVEGLALHPTALGATRRGDDRARLLADVCFATRGRGEVLLGDRKLVGLSQRRRRSGVLVQCGMVRRWRPRQLLAALGADPDDAGIAASAVGLDDAMPAAPENATVADAVSARLAAWTCAGVAGATEPVGRSEAEA